MKDVILIALAGLIALGILVPFVNAFSKWKKEMESDDDVHNG